MATVWGGKNSLSIVKISSNNPQKSPPIGAISAFAARYALGSGRSSLLSVDKTRILSVRAQHPRRQPHICRRCFLSAAHHMGLCNKFVQ